APTPGWRACSRSSTAIATCCGTSPTSPFPTCSRTWPGRATAPRPPSPPRGLYPDVPDGGDYALGTPLFDRATVTLAGGTLTLEAPHASPASIYVKSATLDGRTVGQRLAYGDLAGGGTLQLVLGDAP